MSLSLQRAAVLLATIFIATALLDLPALADPPAAAGANAFGGATPSPLNEITNFNGKLKGMRQGFVVVEKEDGTEALVALPDSIAAFQFVAQAKPAFLRRGMLVRCSGQFGPGGVPTAPINKITLFQPVDLRSVEGRAKEQFTAGIHSDARKGNRNQQVLGKATVVGSLIGLFPAPNGAVLAVQAGKFPVRLPVSPDADLEIRYNNLNLAQEGDKVAVAGFYQPPNENQIKADRITVTTDRVFGEAEPQGDRRSRRSRRDGNAEAGDEGKKPAEEASPEKEEASEKAGDAGEEGDS